MRKTLTYLVLLFVVSTTFAQNIVKEKSTLVNSNNTQILKFTEFKLIDNQYMVVYFCIDGIEDDLQKNELTTFFEEKSFIKKARIYNDINRDIRCQLEVKRDVTANDIFLLLKKKNLDFKYISVKEIEK